MAGPASLADCGEFLLFDPITDQTVRPIVEGILKVNNGMTETDEIKLYISSPGGSVWAGFALIDIMKSSRVPIKTIGLGGIASCGLLIFMAGTKGRRIVTTNTSILSHQFSAMYYGKDHELLGRDKEMDLIREKLKRHYKNNSTADDEVINKYLLGATDAWLTPKEMLKYGMCDYVKDLESPKEKTKKRVVVTVKKEAVKPSAKKPSRKKN